MKFETLRLETDTATQVATVTLSRGPRNALDAQMCLDLDNVFAALAGDATVGAVVLTGDGPGFCAGGDLKNMGITYNDAPTVRTFMAACHRAILAMRRMEKPVVAAVNGDAAGAGWSLALACDLIVAAAEARFIMAFVRVGAVPDLGAAWFLPRLVGPHKAREWMMLGDVVAAEEAHRLNVVNRLVPPEDVLPAAREIAARLAAGPGRSLALTKQMVERYANCSLEAALEHESYTQAIAFQTDDFAEGRSAFFEKRKPAFKGK
jgi:2-(1,2-epoxy-1,2-dihydrophenyl)acetyl-CoA isomerase